MWSMVCEVAEMSRPLGNQLIVSCQSRYAGRPWSTRYSVAR